VSKGFTLMELVLTVIVLSILSAFTFSVIWQYSQLYADTKKGYIYGEAAAVLERMSRELRDANNVCTAPFGTSNPAQYVNFSITHGTPATGTTPYWAQYCTCTPSGGKLSLYRVTFNWLSDGTDSNQCLNSCPPTGPHVVTVPTAPALMSRNIMSSGFQVRYFPGNPTPDGDSYEITLKLASDGSANNPSIRLVTRVFPRNLPPGAVDPARSFDGGYYDKNN
jgi:prepilin-type N-terminal cleavage/methylation domain-containing protein